MEILKVFYQITLYLLPAVGIVLMIITILAVGKINKILDGADKTVGKVNDTIDEIQKPLSTVVKISGGVDAVYDYSEKAVKGLGVKITEIINYLKKWITSSLNKSEGIKEENEDAE